MKKKKKKKYIYIYTNLEETYPGTRVPGSVCVLAVRLVWWTLAPAMDPSFKTVDGQGGTMVQSTFRYHE